MILQKEDLMPVKVLSFNPISVGLFYTIFAALGAILQIGLLLITTSKLTTPALVQPLIGIPAQFLGGCLIAFLYNLCSNKQNERLTLEFTNNIRVSESTLISSIEPLSFGKVLAFVYGIIGLVLGSIMALIGLFTKKYILMAGLIAYPLAMILGGLVGGVISAIIYNFCANYTGGYELYIKMEGNQDGRLLKVGILQLGKLSAFIVGVLSVIAVVLILLASFVIPNIKFQMTFLLFPIGAAVVAFISGCVGGFLSNIVLKLSNGIELAFDGIPPEGGGGEDKETEKQSA